LFYDEFTFFGVMESSRPIDGDIGLILTQLYGPVHGRAGIVLTKLKESIKDGTVGRISRVESLHTGRVLSSIVGSDLGQE
jgi:hypothetical protein